MTIITLSTVVFTKVHSLSDGGRIWAMFVITFGIIGYAILSSHLKDAFIHLDIYRRKKMMKTINKLYGHFIILGYGRMGAVIAHELNQKGQNFVVVEKNQLKLKRLLRTECFVLMEMLPWMKL